MKKLFQILVPDNTLVSRIISCENQVTELFVIDRADKNFVAENSSELNKPALYILINRDKKQLYVGETDDSLKRLRNHEAKDFWTEAIVFHSTRDTLSTTEVKWLEAKTYEALKELGYYDLSENKQAPQQPPLKKNQIYTLEPIFEEAKNYICAAGFDIFLKKKENPVEQPVVNSPLIESPVSANDENNIWLLPSSKKRFDLEACFKEYGEVYWRISNNFKRINKGDRGYIYSSDPDKAIIYRFEVVESQLTYSSIMSRDDKFSKNKGDSNKDFGKNGGLFVRIKRSGIVKDKRFALNVLLEKGLHGAPQGAIRISQEEYKPLLEFLDENFDKQIEKGNKSRRPPFKFSMIGLKKGDTLVFDSTGINVRIATENTIEYKGVEYTLNQFVLKYLPNDKRTPSEAYQGPKYFSFQGKNLWRLRLLIEKEQRKK